MPKKCTKKNIEKEFFKYYSKKGLETFIKDMERVYEVSKKLNNLKENSRKSKSEMPYMDLQEITQKGISYILNLPIGKKAKPILMEASNNIIQRKKLQESYQNTMLVLDKIVHGYRNLFDKKYKKVFNEAYEDVIISQFLKKNSLY